MSLLINETRTVSRERTHANHHVLWFQRKGVSNNYYLHPLTNFPGSLHVSYDPYPPRDMRAELTFSGAAHRDEQTLRTVFEHLTDFDHLADRLSDMFGCLIVWSGIHIAYAHPASHNDTYLAEFGVWDRYLSTATYIQAMDEPLFHCLQFRDSEDPRKALQFSVLPTATQWLREFVADCKHADDEHSSPPGNWFHECDYRKGVAYCRQRFAWLLNEKYYEQLESGYFRPREFQLLRSLDLKHPINHKV